MIDHKGHFSAIDTPPKTETKATLRDQTLLQTPRTVVEEMCDAHHEGDVDALVLAKLDLEAWMQLEKAPTAGDRGGGRGFERRAYQQRLGE